MKRLLTIILALLMLLAVGCTSSTPVQATNEVGDLFDQLAETEEQAKERIYKGVKNELMTDTEKQMMTEAERARSNALESAIQDALQNGTREELEQRIAEWKEFAEDLRAVFSAYRKFDLTPFSDAELSMLSKDELEEYYSFQQRIDEAFAARKVKDLNLLNNQWQSFQSAAKRGFEAAREKMLNDWVSGADLGSSITGLFSLGTIKTTTTVSGHKITVSTQYLTDYGASDSQIKNAMESYLNLMSSMFQNVVNSLGYVAVAIDDEHRGHRLQVIGCREPAHGVINSDPRQILGRLAVSDIVAVEAHLEYLQPTALIQVVSVVQNLVERRREVALIDGEVQNHHIALAGFLNQVVGDAVVVLQGDVEQAGHAHLHRVKLVVAYAALALRAQHQVHQVVGARVIRSVLAE